VIPETAIHFQEETIFRNLLEAAPDAMVVVDAHGRIIFANACAETLFGYAREKILGQTVEMLVPSRFRASHSGHRNAFTAASRVRPMGAGIQLYAQRSDGTEFPVDISLSPLTTEEGMLVLAAIRDVSQRVAMQAQLDASRMQVVSSARLSALGMMAGSIAHEINNPLGIIHAYASNLLERAGDDGLPASDIKKVCSRIVETTERIASIVRGLRHIAREGSADPFAPASVGGIVQRALELCRERFRTHSISLISPEVDASLRVCCREVQIVQILLNLLQNAFDAISDIDGDRWVAVKAGLEGQNISFSVIDSGPGIASEVRERIMEPFFTTKPVGKGTGLGLSISRSIAQDHGGDLRYEEREGHTCFSLTLPTFQEEPSRGT
jgi:PAS domain S-box-containing protein